MTYPSRKWPANRFVASTLATGKPAFDQRRECVAYVLGVDGGGSQTTAVLADAGGRLVSVGRAQGSNHQGVGIEVAMLHVREAVEVALEQARIGLNALEYVQYGLAGADRDFAILRPGLAALPYGPWHLVSDAWQGLRAGTSDYVGVSLVCGSGTNAVGRNQKGLEVQVGGFGYLFGDTAGGRDLAHDGFRGAIRHWQRRGEATLLSQLIPAHLGMPDMEAVYNHFLYYDAVVPLDVALLVHQGARQGDSVSKELLRAMGRELGLACNAVMDQLGIDNEPMPVVLVGSVLQKGRSPILLGALQDTVRSRFEGTSFSMLDVPPVYGSVLLALDHLGRQPAPDARRTFEEWEEESYGR